MYRICKDTKTQVQLCSRSTKDAFIYDGN